MFLFDKKYQKQAEAKAKQQQQQQKDGAMEQLENTNLAKVPTCTRQLFKTGPAIVPIDKRNRNGFIAFLLCFYRQFNQLDDEEKELYVGSRYRLVLIVPTASDPDIPDDVDEDEMMIMLWWNSLGNKHKHKLLPL